MTKPSKCYAQRIRKRLCVRPLKSALNVTSVPYRSRSPPIQITVTDAHSFDARRWYYFIGGFYRAPFDCRRVSQSPFWPSVDYLRASNVDSCIDGRRWRIIIAIVIRRQYGSVQRRNRRYRSFAIMSVENGAVL
uniref:Uncharacterized protein n=1 Tax=Panagrellus redivivus TaxID=6233 RepID=A0A7E4USK0_PANRE